MYIEGVKCHWKYQETGLYKSECKQVILAVLITFRALTYFATACGVLRF